MLESFDVAAAAGVRRAIVKDFAGITVSRAVFLELVPKTSDTSAETAPILSGIEILSEK